MRIYLKARILPAFGKMPLDRIGPEDVAAWFDAASKDKPGAANRAFEILRAMMFRAEEWGLRARDSNPCLGIAKNPRNHVARFLDAGELTRLGRALDAREAQWPEAVAAVRLLALTGCRRGEVLTLRWHDIGADAINLADSKTGPRAVPLGKAARAQIDALPGKRHPGAFLFPKLAEGRYSHSLVESLSRCPRFLWHEAGCRHIIRRQGAEKGRKRAEARPPTACVRPATNPPGRPEPDYLGQRHKLSLLSAGGRFAKIRGSAGCACTTFCTPPPVRPSCPARTCPWSADCSGTVATAQRRATPTSPTGIWLRRRRG